MSLYSCTKCGFSSDKQKKVDNHIMKQCPNVTLECEFCKLNFNSKNNLKNHKMNLCIFKEKNMCNVCQKVLLSSQEKRHHMKYSSCSSSASSSTENLLPFENFVENNSPQKAMRKNLQQTFKEIDEAGVEEFYDREMLSFVFINIIKMTNGKFKVKFSDKNLDFSIYSKKIPDAESTELIKNFLMYKLKFDIDNEGELVTSLNMKELQQITVGVEAFINLLI